MTSTSYHRQTGQPACLNFQNFDHRVASLRQTNITRYGTDLDSVFCGAAVDSNTDEDSHATQLAIDYLRLPL